MRTRTVFDIVGEKAALDGVLTHLSFASRQLLHNLATSLSGAPAWHTTLPLARVLPLASHLRALSLLPRSRASRSLAPPGD
jgi:hypothetical protein